MSRVETSRPGAMEVRYGDKRIMVKVVYRDSDSLTVHVDPDGTVTALAPMDQPVERVAQRLQRRASWIFKQIRFFEQFLPAPVPRRYVSGETLCYMGRQYRLLIKKSSQPSTRLLGQYLVVQTPVCSDTNTVRAMVNGWYRQRAQDVLPKRMAEAVALTRTLNLAEPVLRLRSMKKRWSSCTPKGLIILNPQLVIVPRPCIDYVLVHELCHRKVLQHNAAFYRLLGRYLPDWEKRKARLDRYPQVSLLV